MKYRRKLFSSKDIYNLPPTDQVFINAMKDNIIFHMENCLEYKEILDHFGFELDDLKNVEDLWKIPALPTSYLKSKTMLSKPYDKLLIKTTSSGTSGGKKTLSGYDKSSALCALSMALKVFRFHKLISFRRTNYIVLGVKPDKNNQSATAKGLAYFTILAPAKKVEYAVKVVNGEYQVDVESLIKAVVKFDREGKPVRIIGLPGFFKIFITELIARDIKLNLHKNSKVLLGGGWKTFFADEISKEELFAMANETLGMRRQNFKDHFSTTEHPVNYVACENNHFHVPVFSRVIIRDVNTLEPVENGVPGVLNLITPILSNAPYGSIITDDIAVLRDNCGCGSASPYLDIIGRVGLSNIRTCTQQASEFLKNL